MEFPINPANRGFIYKEKLLHICLENVLSICVVIAYLVNENSTNSCAIISLISSALMCILLLFANGCDVLFSTEVGKGNYASTILTLRKEDIDSRLSKRKLRKRFEGMLDVNFVTYLD